MADKISIIGLLGEHIENSISPFIHHKFIRYYSLNYCYVPFQIKREELLVAITGARTLGICGLNVTIPFKKNAMQFIDNNDLAAERIGAINTIVRKNGKLYGYNTDWIGFHKPLSKNGGINFNGKKALILGAGGAARAVVYALAEGRCSAISIFNRSEWRAVELKRNFQHIFPQCEIKIFPWSGPSLEGEISEANLLINATPLGSWYYPGQNPLSEEIKLPPQLIVYDLIYYPDKTPLLRWAEKSGNKIINGKEMLIYQAVESFYLWTNIYPDQKIINQTIKQIREIGRG